MKRTIGNGKRNAVFVGGRPDRVLKDKVNPNSEGNRVERRAAKKAKKKV